MKQKNNHTDYDDNMYIKIKINSNNDLPWNKSLLMFHGVIIIRSLLENNAYYSQISLLYVAMFP